MKKILTLLILLGGAAAGLVVWQPWADEAPTGPGVDRAIAETVGVRTLTDEITVRGELRRDQLQTITSATAGQVSGLTVEDGQIVEAGDPLFTIDGRQTVAVVGGFAFYRQLDVGSEGHDVHQLEKVLDDGGYVVGEVDGFYTEETRSGLAAWQTDHGYSGSTTEANEVVTVSLQQNPAGYTVGPVNAVSVRIGPALPDPFDVQGNQATSMVAVAAAVSVADAPVPTVSLNTAAVVVEEGRPVVVTVSADVATTTDLEIPLLVTGDVVVDDDYRKVDPTVVLPAGQTTVTVEVVTLVDDDPEPYEDLTVAISGGFDSVAEVSSQNLLVYDLEVQIREQEERREEVADEIAEAVASGQDLREYDIRAEIADAEKRREEVADEIVEAQEKVAEEEIEVTALETLQRLKTEVEQELMDKSIITMAQAIEADLTPIEAQQLMSLDDALDTANDDLEAEDITYAAWREAFEAYYDALNEALEESAELTAARDALEAETDALTLLLDEQDRLDYLLDDAAERLADVLEAEDTALSALRDEQDRLDYLLDDAAERLADVLETEDTTLSALRDEQDRLDYLLQATREDLRVAQAARYVLSENDEVTVSIDDPDVPDVPILVLRADSETVRESGSATFTIETTMELVEDLDVFYVVEGTATADADYNAPDGDITMSKGQERVVLTVPVRADDDVEGDETLIVRLIADPEAAYQLSDRDQATMLIESDDLPELTVTGGGEVVEGDTATVVIWADQPPDADTSVHYSVTGSAQAGVDYEVVTGTALLRAGEKSVTISIRTIDDDVFFLPSDMVVADWPVRVGTVAIEDGDLVQRGTPLFDLTEPVFTVKLFASPTDRAQLAEGQEVTVNLAAGDQEVDGVITELDDNATISGNSEIYEGVVGTTEDLVGVDGAVVTIDVVVEQSVDAVVVPIAAVLSDGGQDTVRVVTPEGVIERRAVEVGMLDGAYVEVVSGVSAGEFVILEIDRS
jgi:peptidoglycan hydrolase-like protein with peptidoglycan-binding domain